MYSPKHIRNLAIIAHIDHGKTTLVDSLLKQSRVLHDHAKLQERAMDSNDQERERGITIFAKQTCVPFGDYKINIVDTPGHADFSGEVERVLGMVNSVLLLVDAQEGPMPQTRFVLSKSLRMGLKPLVAINKIDRPQADPDKVLDKTFDLFVELGASHEQLDFPYCYVSGLAGFAIRELGDERRDMRPLFDFIVENVPAPTGEPEAPFLMQVSQVSFDDYVGRLVSGRILRGKVEKGMSLIHMHQGGTQRGSVVRVEAPLGLEKVEIESAGVGDIVTLAGFPQATIGDTLCDPLEIVHLPPIALDAPTVSVDISANSSPFVGRSGNHVTMSKIRERLEREKRANISLAISLEGEEKVTVAGRGELHLAVLIEQMRREGYEFSLSKPQIVAREEEGVLLEPIERVHIEVPSVYSGAVIEQLSQQRGEMQSLETSPEGITYLSFLMPTRGLIGYRNGFLSMTHGLGVLTSIFEAYAPWKGALPGKGRGALIAAARGSATAYALWSTQERGILFISPGEEVYEGMVVGEHARENDLIVNVCRTKQLTNVRAAGSDPNIILIPPLKLTLEQAIGYIRDDELIEVTPTAIRLRKRFLTENERKQRERKGR